MQSIFSRTIKTPMIRLPGCTGRSESSLSTFTIAKDWIAKYFHADNEDRLSDCLGAKADRTESSLGAFWIVRIAKYLLADNEDSDDQTAWMHGQIRIFTGHIYDSQGLDCKVFSRGQ